MFGCGESGIICCLHKLVIVRASECDNEEEARGAPPAIQDNERTPAN